MAAAAANINKSSSEQHWIKVTISDTGDGICERNQGLIFQKYQQENLAIARTHMVAPDWGCPFVNFW